MLKENNTQKYCVGCTKFSNAHNNQLLLSLKSWNIKYVACQIYPRNQSDLFHWFWLFCCIIKPVHHQIYWTFRAYNSLWQISTSKKTQKSILNRVIHCWKKHINQKFQQHRDVLKILLYQPSKLVHFATKKLTPFSCMT